MEDRGLHQGWPHSTAVIGAGTMGLGVAECFAAAGVEVRLTDATPELTEKARGRLVERARGHAEAGLLSREAVERVAGVETADDVSAAVRGVGLVFEAVPESLELKQEILPSCSEAAPQEAVIVSNTSSLPIGRLAGPLGGPGRVLGMHWFNPPQGAPRGEGIPAAETHPEGGERVVG